MNLNTNDRAIVVHLCQNYEQADEPARARLKAINDDALEKARARRTALQHELRAVARAIAMREMFEHEVADAP